MPSVIAALAKKRTDFLGDSPHVLISVCPVSLNAGRNVYRSASRPPQSGRHNRPKGDTPARRTEKLTLPATPKLASRKLLQLKIVRGPDCSDPAP